LLLDLLRNGHAVSAFAENGYDQQHHFFKLSEIGSFHALLYYPILSNKYGATPPKARRCIMKHFLLKQAVHKRTVAVRLNSDFQTESAQVPAHLRPAYPIYLCMHLVHGYGLRMR
jgi:hypothetical protein